MFKVIDKDIYMTRGDTGMMSFKLAYSDGTPYELAMGEQIIFTMKYASNIGKPIVCQELTGEDFIFEFKHEYTDHLLPGSSYIYDVQLIDQQEHVYTIVNGTITLDKEVGTWQDYRKRSR